MGQSEGRTDMRMFSFYLSFSFVLLKAVFYFRVQVAQPCHLLAEGVHYFWIRRKELQEGDSFFTL